MKTNHHKHLNGYDRARIETLLNQGYTQYSIAKILGFHRSTISREVKNRGAILSGYKAEYAQKDYVRNKKYCGAKSKIEQNQYLFSYVVNKIKVGWSPEVISGRLSKEIKEHKLSPDMYINHESIYQFVFESACGKRENLKQYLRRGKGRRTKKEGRKTKREMIPNKVSIEKRPAYIEKRKSIGHWEGDTIMYGKQKGLNSLVERKSRYLILSKLNDKTPRETAMVVAQGLMPHICKTITLDNGVENRDHETIADMLHTKIYFCHAYASWEKGTNEQTNGIVRRYLPKKTNIDIVSQEDVDDIAYEINNRPRKVLQYSTPQEVLTKDYQIVSNVAFNS
jgi:transposase, IS30 family